MYRKILVPLDGSPLAETVIPHVRMLAESQPTEIFLLQIVVDPIYDLILSGPKLAAATHDRASTQRVQSQNYLNHIAACLREHGIKVTTIVCEGVVAETILAYGEKFQVDLIILAAHGVNTPSGWQLGNVTYRIVHDAQVPVLLVRPKQSGFKHAQPPLALTQSN